MLPGPLDQSLEQSGRFARAVASPRLARGREGALNLSFVHDRSISKSDRIDKRDRLAVVSRRRAGGGRSGGAVIPRGAGIGDVDLPRIFALALPLRLGLAGPVAAGEGSDP